MYSLNSESLYLWSFRCGSVNNIKLHCFRYEKKNCLVDKYFDIILMFCSYWIQKCGLFQSLDSNTNVLHMDIFICLRRLHQMTAISESEYICRFKAKCDLWNPNHFSRILWNFSCKMGIVMVLTIYYLWCALDDNKFHTWLRHIHIVFIF